MIRRTVQHLHFFEKIILIPIYLFLRLWYLTLRLQMDSGTRTVLSFFPSQPCVFYLWHQSLFVAPMLRSLRKNRFMYGLISASSDGAWLEALVKWFNVQAIRGSSTWRGSHALHELEQRKHTVCDIIITPDGPKGPPYQCKRGSLRWAWHQQFMVMPMKIECSHAWRLNSWDYFCIPKPFSTIRLKIYMLNPKDFSSEAFQAEVQKLL